MTAATARPRVRKAVPIILAGALLLTAGAAVTLEVNLQERRAVAEADLERNRAQLAETRAQVEEGENAVSAAKEKLAEVQEQLKSTEGFIE